MLQKRVLECGAYVEMPITLDQVHRLKDRSVLLLCIRLDGL